MINIISATTKEHFDAAKILFKEYATWLNIDLCFQNFEEELNNINTMYQSPMGTILLAYIDSNLIGCVAVRQKQDLIAELKRMYVKPTYRNVGAGKKLLNEALMFAKNAGYKTIKLDTLATMTPAIKLYTQLGFVETTAYYFNPEENAVFFEREL